MHPTSLQVFCRMTEQFAPVRLGDYAGNFSKYLFGSADQFASGGRIRDRQRLRHCLVEFLISERSLVPCFSCSVGDCKCLDTERTHRPNRQRIGVLVPSAPKVVAGRTVRFTANPASRSWAAIAFPVLLVPLLVQRNKLMFELLLTSVGHQSFGALDIPRLRRQLHIVRMDRTYVMVLGRRTKPANSKLLAALSHHRTALRLSRFGPRWCARSVT